ncbi:PLP-dependent aminotransferase family protein [Granulicella sp. WH15]|uniref:aminotransferase-like domain-containing protein n=1 Tax=Granulicella sp. WH15 TaxID=2602070 RepID=UPI0013A56780|nr:PLP-dependent aminotransferase family protein [Granulicella sp. WH15]
MSNATATPESTRPASARWISSSNNLTQQFLSFGGQPDMVSLAGGLPAAELYPVAAIQAASQRALANHGTAALEYGPVEGLPALRQLIADRVSAETGGSFSPANVMLTTGAMQALDLIGKVLVDAGDLIVTQSPTYVGALDAWRPRSPRYHKLDWTLHDPSLDRNLREAKFVYTVPNYSNPTGVLVSQECRAALLEKVIEAGTWLVEDDPYHSLQLDGPTGQTILHHYVAQNPGPYAGPVIYLGTVSKSLVPGLRVGWIIAEANLIQSLAVAKMSSDLSSSMFTQAVAFELLHANVDRTHAATMIPAYRERRDALCREAALRLSPWFEWETPVGGMFVWMRARNNAIDTNELYRFAVEEKVAFVPSSVFDFTGEDRFAMRVNFTRNAPEVLAEGVRRLERAIRNYLAAQKTP